MLSRRQWNAAIFWTLVVTIMLSAAILFAGRMMANGYSTRVGNGATDLYASGDAGACILGSTEVPAQEVGAAQSPTLWCKCVEKPADDVRAPTVTPIPAACRVDTATPGVTDTDTPGQPTPQATPTSTVPPVATPTHTPEDTPTPVPSSTPIPEPTATDTPAPTGTPSPVPTDRPSKTPKPTYEHCNHGGGNGSEGCDPGRDPTQSNDDGDN